MSKRYWFIIAAFGLILFPTSGQPQEKAGNEQRQERAQHSPPKSLYPPLRIEIVEDQAEADARKRREDETRQNEIADLRAQQGMNAATQAMNAATQDMRDYTFYSTIFTGIGALLVFGSLILMVQANGAAVSAVKVARASLGDNRAWLLPFNVIPVVGSGDLNTRSDDGEIKRTSFENCFLFKVVFKNNGRTPAVNCFIKSDYKMASVDDVKFNRVNIPTFDKQIENDNGAGAVIGPDTAAHATPIHITERDSDKIRSRTHVAIIYCTAIYRDIYNHAAEHRTEYCCVAHFNGVMINSDGSQVPNFEFGNIGDQNTAN